MIDLITIPYTCSYLETSANYQKRVNASSVLYKWPFPGPRDPVTTTQPRILGVSNIHWLCLRIVSTWCLFLVVFLRDLAISARGNAIWVGYVIDPPLPSYFAVLGFNVLYIAAHSLMRRHTCHWTMLFLIFGYYAIVYNIEEVLEVGDQYPVNPTVQPTNHNTPSSLSIIQCALNPLEQKMRRGTNWPIRSPSPRKIYPKGKPWGGSCEYKCMAMPVFAETLLSWTL